MSRIITDSKVSGQYYIPSLSLSLDTKNAKKKCGHSKEDKTKRQSRTWCCFAPPPPPFEQPVVVIPGMFGRDSIVGNARLLLLERLCPSRNRRFKRGIIGKKYSAPFLCVLCACIFSSKKRRQNTSKQVNKTNPTTCKHSYQTKRGGAYYTSRSKTRPPSLANIHPSIHRTTTHYYYYRIETPTTIAGVKRSREREREIIF